MHPPTKPLPDSKKISVSLLSADFGKLAHCARLGEAAGVDSIHLDVVDGHFAQNFAFGPDAVNAVRKATDLPLTVHLEIDCPDLFLEPFARAGADTILFHPETSADPLRAVEQIRHLGKRPGFALVPSMPVAVLEEIISAVPTLLLLGVPPGFGGAPMSPEIYEKIHQVLRLADRTQSKLEIIVDGGVNLSNASALAAAGAEVFVSGSYLLNGEGLQSRVNALRKAIQVS